MSFPTENGTPIHRSPDPLQNGLDTLNHLVTEAEANLINARRESDSSILADHEAVVALRTYQDGVFFRRPDTPPDPDRERALTAALASELVQNPDLRLVSLGGSRFQVEDVGPARRLREAQAALREATRCRDEYLQEHAEEFKAARREEEWQAFREALDSGNTAAVRNALGLDDAQEGRALRTSDLAG